MSRAGEPEQPTSPTVPPSDGLLTAFMKGFYGYGNPHAAGNPREKLERLPSVTLFSAIPLPGPSASR